MHLALRTPQCNPNDLICGIDEAGRGPLAGPVVAAAVILSDGTPLPEVNDSKKLSASKREALFTQIQSSCRIGVGIASVKEIDELNIYHASLLAMQRAFVALHATAPITALVDGNAAPKLDCTVRTCVGGDAMYAPIAAASIIAKVTRDRMMTELCAIHPHYGWSRNAGYGTKHHLQALKQHGVTTHHRRSFAPVRACLNVGKAA